ncbi:MAG: ABC transporter ATP-binding protein [Oscillochloridaceae bacterium umkhey_bin13]
MQTLVAPYRTLFRTYLAPQWPRLLLLAALLSLNLGLQLGLPRVVQTFIDQAIGGSTLQVLIGLGLLYLGVAISQNLILVGWQYVAQNIGLLATNQIRADLTRHCLQLDLSFHNARTPGELIERVDGDVGKLEHFLAQFMIQLLLNGLLVIGVVLMLFLIDWRVALPSAIGVVVAAVSAILLSRPVTRYSAEERQASAELFGLLEERLAGTEDLRANGGVAYVLRRHLERSRALFRASVLRSLFAVLSWRALSMAIMISGIVALLIGALLALDGVLTLGQVYLIFAYTTLLEHPVDELQRQLNEVQQAIASLARVEQLFAIQPKLVAPTEITALPSGALSVTLDEVGFAYPDGEPVLQNVSLQLGAGQSLGLIGRTGSGKTTLTRLLLRLYDPTAGSIRLGGVELRAVAQPALRTRVAVVTQEIQLFSATVRDNLTFFDPTMSDAQLLQALDTLGIGAWVRSLPQGLDTPLAAGGSGLSAGQAQLLAFGRAFLRDPGLIILDEASSRLDPATERQLDHALRELLKGRTAIIIAHRLGTLERVDQIMLLEQGQVVEHGARVQLKHDPDSRFAHLLQLGLEATLA